MKKEYLFIGLLSIIYLFSCSKTESIDPDENLEPLDPYFTATINDTEWSADKAISVLIIF